MHAIDDVSDALETTRNFLTPVRWRFWLKLAVVVFFISSLGFSGSSFSGGDPGTFSDDPGIETESPDGEVPTQLEDEVPVSVWLFVLLIGGFLFLFWATYQLIAAVMEFVFVESLRSTEVHILRYFTANLWSGIHLFLFRIGVLLVVGVLGIAPAAVLVYRGGFADLSAGVFIAYVLYGIILYLVLSLVGRFTTEFVVPVMLLEDRGVLSAWSRFWSTFTANWAEYVVYLLLVWILSLAVTIGVWFVVLFGVLALLIPFGIVAVLLMTLGDIGLLLAIPVALIALVTILLFVSLVWTPITTYFRYYALLVLGDTNDELDLIPDQRAAVRADGGHSSGRADDRFGGDHDDRYGWGDDREDDQDPWDDSSSARDDDPWDDREDDHRERDDRENRENDDRSW